MSVPENQTVAASLAKVIAETDGVTDVYPARGGFSAAVAVGANALGMGERPLPVRVAGSTQVKDVTVAVAVSGAAVAPQVAREVAQSVRDTLNAQGLIAGHVAVTVARVDEYAGSGEVPRDEGSTRRDR